MLGMHGSVYANYAVDQADLLLAFGVRFDDRVTGKVSEFAKHGKIVHIDIDPSEINKNKEAAYSDRQRHQVCARRAEQDRRAAGRPDRPGTRRSRPGNRATRSSTTRNSPASCRSRPSTNCRSLTRDRETIISVGVGQHQMWAAQHYKFREPRTWLSSSGLGTMGFGLPAAMGAKTAHPESWSSTSTATAAS